MKVQDVMTKDAVFCLPTDNPAKAAALMMQYDCGIVPILTAEKKVVGVVTDRDICLAYAKSSTKLSTFKLEVFTDKKIISCQPKDKIEDALKKMKKNQLKRLVVTSQDAIFVGIISIADILIATDKHKSLTKKVISTLRSISKPFPITLREI